MPDTANNTYLNAIIGYVVFVFASVSYFAFTQVLDTLWSRRRAADHINAAKARVLADPSDVQALDEIKSYARGRIRFQRCYAASVLGQLGHRAVSAMPILLEMLGSSDGFEIEAAARALGRWGPEAAPAKRYLIQAMRRWPNWGAGAYAAEALGQIGDASPEVVETLRYAAQTAEFSMLREHAAKAYHRLTGQDVPPR